MPSSCYKATAETSGLERGHRCDIDHHPDPRAHHFAAGTCGLIRRRSRPVCGACRVDFRPRHFAKETGDRIAGVVDEDIDCPTQSRTFRRDVFRCVRQGKVLDDDMGTYAGGDSEARRRSALRPRADGQRARHRSPSFASSLLKLAPDAEAAPVTSAAFLPSLARRVMFGPAESERCAALWKIRLRSRSSERGTNFDAKTISRSWVPLTRTGMSFMTDWIASSATCAGRST